MSLPRTGLLVWTVAVSAIPLLCTPAAGGERWGLVVGNNEGLDQEPPLAFAEADAAGLATTLVEVAALAPGHVRLLRGVGLEEVERVLRTVTSQLQREDTFFFLFSGHGDEVGAHVGGQVWPWGQMRATLDACGARVVVAFIDACRSGAILTAKGLVRGPPLRVTLSHPGAWGHFIVTSSGINETAYESVRLRTSPFAHFLGSGLRGAADLDADGRVTLHELYTYLYTHTLAATLSAPAGPQRPAERLELTGTGEIVLVELGKGHRRVFRESADLGTCYLLDAGGVRVIAELDSRPGAAVAVAPGSYQVKCLAGENLKVAIAQLSNQDLRLEDLRFEAAALSYALAKGPDGARRTQVEVGAGLSSRSERTIGLPLGLRLRREQEGGSWDVELGGDPLRGTAIALAGLGARFPWWRVAGSHLELGIEAGVDAKWREASRAEAVVGPFARLVWLELEGWSPFVRLDLLSSVPLDGSDSPGVAVSLSAGLGFELEGLGDQRN